MDKGLCLKIAEQMDVLLQRELAQGIEPYRMLSDAPYTRDVLLVCDAMPGSELASLARQFRAAAAPPPAEIATAPRRRAEPVATAPDSLPAESLPADSLPAGETLPPRAKGARDSRFSPSRFFNSLFGSASDFDGAPARPRTRHWLSPSRWLDK
ncbi:MAG: hypothetical protein KF683_02680 [Rubrivivax sp.]|nr:hypothetical protein [Rubrivivax sp.]